MTERHFASPANIEGGLAVSVGKIGAQLNSPPTSATSRNGQIASTI